MATLSEMKASSPAYQALTDQEFADRIYSKFYAETISREEFDRRTAAPDVAGELAAPFAGFNKGVDALINLPGTVLNLGARGINYGAETLGYEAPLPDQPFEPVRVATLANAGYEPRTAAGRVGEAIGEVAGASVLPSAGLFRAGTKVATAAAPSGSALTEGLKNIARRSAASPGSFARNEAAAAVGGGTGVGLAREAELGPVGEFVGGLAGAFAAPAVVTAASRTGGAIKDAASYGGRMLERARNPQLAADQDVADAILKAGGDFDQLRREFAPTPSSALQARGFTDADLADIISRRTRGETAASIARDYTSQGKPIADSTVGSYLSKHREMTPTPRNIIDAIKDIYGEGAYKPVSRLGRAAYGIADDAEGAQALTSRQETQPGRVTGIIKNAAGGRNFDDEVSRLDEVLTRDSQAAYRRARANAQPFNLKPSLMAARETAQESAGDIRTGLNKAIDLFFEPVAQPKRISAMEDVRMKEMAERIAKAEAAENPDLERIAQLKRRFDAMRDDAEFNANAKPEIIKIGKPISDIERFQNARAALDDMITTAKAGEPKLHAKLTAFRKTVNNVMRNANPEYAAADDMFSGAKSTQRILEDGEALTTRLGAKADDALKGFQKLTPQQKELYRLGFLRRLETMVANLRDGAGVANQFQSEAVRKIVRKLFGNDPRLAGQENRIIRERGERLIKDLRQEATTTRTKNDILSGSRTAEYAMDMNKMLQGAETAADIATGRLGKVLTNLSNRLMYQIGEKQAQAIMRTLIETDPAELLPTLNRLAQQAKTTQQRQAYVTAIRQARGVGLGAIPGSGTVAAQD